MIFVTVGTQLPFDRLIGAVDAWSGRTGRSDILAQIGPSRLRPKHIECRPFISPKEYSQHFESAELIISHAGMGSIIGAMNRGKRILVMPRIANLNEHRSDHQMATAQHFRKLGRVLVAMDADELAAQLDQWESIPVASRAGPNASPELIAVVRDFISTCDL